MRLADLTPSFVLPVDEGHYHLVDQIDDAQGVTFQCPACMRARPDGVGVHYVLCWTPRVPPTWSPGPGRWTMSGTGYDDLTLSPSVSIGAPCGAHFFVLRGAIVFC